jgi:hypothetical protein
MFPEVLLDDDFLEASSARELMNISETLRAIDLTFKNERYRLYV